MSYQIYLTDGNFLCTVPDTQTVTTFAGVTLIGKAVNGYGTAFNDNIVHLTENFADSTPPANPLVGQIWYDSQSQSIKFYDGTLFNSISVITASATAPVNPNTGDEWYNTTSGQLFIWSGAQWILVGPINTLQSGQNGFVIGSVIQNGTTFYFLKLYADNNLLGIIAGDTLINPDIVGFGNIYPGLNFVSSPTTSIIEAGVYSVSNLSATNALISGALSIGDQLTNGYTLPNTQGINGTALLATGNGTTFWGNVPFTPTGLFGSVQYNDSGILAGASNVFIDPIGNLLVSSTLQASGPTILSGNIYVPNLNATDGLANQGYVVFSSSPENQLVNSPSVFIDIGGELAVGNGMTVEGNSRFFAGLQANQLSTDTYTLPKDAGTVPGAPLITNANGTTAWANVSSLSKTYTVAPASKFYNSGPYQNTSGDVLDVWVWGSRGSQGGTASGMIGPDSSTSLLVCQQSATPATAAPASALIFIRVPSTWYYRVNTDQLNQNGWNEGSWS